MFKKYFKTISSKLNFILIVTVLGVLSLSAFYKYNLYSNQTEIELQNEIQRIQKRLELILPSVIWNLQLDLVKEIIETESLDKSIDAIIIKDLDNNIIVKVNNKNIQLKNNKHQKEFLIRYNKEKLATILIIHNHTKVEKTKATIIKNLILQTIIIILSLVIIFGFFVNKFIISNIEKLQKGISLFAEDKDFDKTIIIDSNDEIAYLSHEFNNMKNELKINWEELENINLNLANRIEEEVNNSREKDKRLFESSKMAQMGEMIGNIAHQWRQPLSAISMLSSGIKAQREMGLTVSEEEMAKAFEKIMERTSFLTQTIEDFRNFVKQDKEYSQVDINQVIKGTVNILHDTVKHLDIKIDLDLEDDIFIYGLKGEISQVILNIINNAKDVLIEKDQDEKLITVISYTQDKNAIIKIKDNAGGIPKDILPKIFDPYFTTKHQAQGTGIGLYMSKDIVEKHHKGELIAHNNDKGAVFTIELPLLES